MSATGQNITSQRQDLIEKSELTQIVFDIRGATTQYSFPRVLSCAPPVGHRERVNQALGINPCDSIRQGKSDAGIPLHQNSNFLFDDNFLISDIANHGLGFSHGVCTRDKKRPNKFAYKIFFDKGSANKLPEEFQEYLMGTIFSLHIWANLDIPIDRNGHLIRGENGYKVVRNNVFTLLEVQNTPFIVSEKPGSYFFE